jgi:hypothetical protein
MHLIPWTLHSGSEQVLSVPVDICLKSNDVSHYSNVHAMWKMAFYVNPTFLVFYRCTS